MLHSTMSVLVGDDGAVDGDFHYPQVWRGSSNSPYGRNLYIMMGDRISGPVLWLSSHAPTTEGWGPGLGVRTPAHSHRSDTYRIALGAHPEQLKENAKWLGHGDYSLLGANEVYVETAGSHGFAVLLIYADRRGFNHGWEQDQDDATLNARWSEQRAVSIFGDGNYFPIHLNHTDALKGARTTFSELDAKRPRLTGSIYDTTGFATLTSGSDVGAIFMADEQSGPVAIVTHNVPFSVESPEGCYGTDVFRLIVKGSVQVGERHMGPGQLRATPAGVLEGPVVHGPEGSTQIMVLADRRGGFVGDAGATETGRHKGQLMETMTLLGLPNDQVPVG
jgi:hypothetical protein